MKVVISCGGLGTRLKEETKYRLNPMAEMSSIFCIVVTGLRTFILCLRSVLPNSQTSDYDITCEGESVERGRCPR
ncbi:MAG: hypothetical protein ANIMEMIM_00169 [Candidatus Argoarchaeum ethanivorans]|uniref:Uncharacterized protein n=1 Tax=Candidatus Argoarchaeum ethanivorans TaxID=2608793 RepID=A0A811T7G3_9EURY|nr:MAG: hypothetical protein ANIMEMIM_00169 [Candidatus Argoarchaeum ethanivorans]